MKKICLYLFISLCCSLSAFGLEKYPKDTNLSHTLGMIHGKGDEYDPALTKSLRAGWIRLNVRSFTGFHNNPDIFNWDRLDKKMHDRQGQTIMVNIRPVLGKTYLTNDYPLLQESFIRYVERLVKRYHMYIDLYQFENEPTRSDRWPNDKWDEFAKLLVRFTKTIKGVDPNAKIVLAGFGGNAVRRKGRLEEAGKLLTILSQSAKDAFDYIDIHNHGRWDRTSLTETRFQIFSNLLKQTRLEDKGILFSENSTWSGTIEGRRRTFQTEQQQAIYLVQTYYLAMGLGAHAVVVGKPQDLAAYGKNPLSRFSVNGLFYNPNRAYDRGRRSGPKTAALATLLMAELTRGTAPSDINLLRSVPAGLKMIEVKGPIPHLVLWQHQGATKNLQIPVDKSGVYYILQPAQERVEQWPPYDIVKPFLFDKVNANNMSISLRLANNLPLVLIQEEDVNRLLTRN